MSTKATPCRSRYYYRSAAGERLDDIPIIDCHGHFGAFFSARLEEEMTSLVKTMDSMSVDRGVAFGVMKSTVGGNEDYRVLNDHTMKAIDMHPDRFLGYAYVDLDVEDDVTIAEKIAVGELERCMRWGMKGLKLIGWSDTEPFSSPRYESIWEFCAEHKWPVIIHGLDLDLPYRYPKTAFIHAHGIERVLLSPVGKLMEDCPNYYVDTTSTMTGMGFIEELVSHYGSERILFGSDFPGNNIATRIGAVLTARISDADIRNILGGNIAKLLKLKLRDSFPM